MTSPATPTLSNAVDWTAEHLGHLTCDDVAKSGRFTGGQRATEALAAFGVSGYASKRNEVWPESCRDASVLSQYIRCELLQLPRVWEAVAGGPSPGSRRICRTVDIAELHPFSWLRRPRGGSVASFLQWLRS